MKFKTTPESQIAFDALCEEFKNIERGVVLRWSDIERVMGRSVDALGGRNIINRWRRWMRRERSIVMHAAPGVGLRVLTHSETVSTRASWRNGRARRQAHWGLSELSTVEPEKLSDHQRRALAIRESSFQRQRNQALASERMSKRVVDDSPTAHQMRHAAREE